MSSTKTSHFVFFPAPAWGHARPFCILATRLVLEQENVVVTFVVAPNYLEKTRKEVSGQFCDESSSKHLQRIRILAPSLSDLNGLSAVEVLGDETCPATYKTLYQAESITCSVTGTTFDAVPSPCAAIIDFFSLPQLHAMRAISGHSVPIIPCVAASAAAIIRLYGPQSLGGAEDIGPKIDAEAARTGMSPHKFGNQIWAHTEGKLVQIPGLPAMHDHEFFPQTALLEIPVFKMVRQAYDTLRQCDAIIITSSYTYESVSLEAFKRGFSDLGKDVHVLGPLLPAGYGTEIRNQEEVSNDIDTFLNRMLVQHGTRSVFFVSFGTVFWPTVPGYFEELIEVLLEKNSPFILACASPAAKLSEQLREKINLSGLGIVTTWCPQQFILNHSATGWFVTHGGFNSIIESLGSGIPLICWPFTADQPAAAAHLTTNLNVAFELFQVRTGDGLKPIHRNGITPAGTREAVGIEVRQTIDLCRSAKGEEMRSNAEKLKIDFAKAWKEGGSARQELRKFLGQYV